MTQAGPHVGRLILKKDGLAGNTTTHFGLDAQDKLKILVVDGDPRDVAGPKRNFLSYPGVLNPAGERDSSLYLPTAIIADGVDAVSLDPYQVVVLCNVSAIPDSLVPRLQSYLRQGGGLLIFGGDRVQMENYNARLAQSSPSILAAQLREKKSGPESGGEKIDKLDTAHPVLQGFSDPILLDSIKSARVWGYSRTTAPGRAALISLANGDPLLMEHKVGAGRILFFAAARRTVTGPTCRSRPRICRWSNP